MKNALHVVLREVCAEGPRDAAPPPAPRVRLALRAPRAPRARRAFVGLAWMLAWTLAWGGAILGFAHKAQAAPLTLAVSEGPVALPVLVADARGFFKDEGLDVHQIDCRSGLECAQRLFDGQADVATVSELVVALNSVARPGITLFGTISASSTQIKLVARRSAAAAAGGGLSGLRVATPPGTSAQYFLDCWLVFNDVDPRRVRLVPRAPEQIPGALARGEVDAAAIWEPWAAQAEAALGTDAVVLPSPRVYTQHFGLVADRGTLAHREPEMAGLLRALVHAQHYIADEPQAARALFAARHHVTPEVAGAWIAEQDYRVRLDQSLVTTMESELRWAARAGLEGFEPGRFGGRSPALLRVIEPALLRRVAPDAVGLVR
jgi:NitT/TauT family transport system substrate-binding protein